MYSFWMEWYIRGKQQVSNPHKKLTHTFTLYKTHLLQENLHQNSSCIPNEDLSSSALFLPLHFVWRTMGLVFQKGPASHSPPQCQEEIALLSCEADSSWGSSSTQLHYSCSNISVGAPNGSPAMHQVENVCAKNIFFLHTSTNDLTSPCSSRI